MQLVGACAVIWGGISLSVGYIVQAEGSRDLIAGGGHRAWLEDRDRATAGIPRRNLIKVYAKAGEVIYLGSSAVGIGSGVINYTAPDGSTGTCGAIGNIANRTEEVNGPAPLTPGGYTPCVVTVTVTTEGVWEIRFISPNTTSSALGANPPDILASDPWVQVANDAAIAAWDVTVVTGTTSIPGRVFANYLPTTLGAFDGVLNSEYYILTKDGYQYRVNTQGQQPFSSIFFANNKGFKDASGNATYKSVNLTTNDDLPTGTTLQNPSSPDTPTDITHKIFFNQPSSDLPATANAPSGSTWLLSPPVAPPPAINFKFTGVEGTPGQAGTTPLGGNFSFDIATASSYQIIIDVNKNGTYGDSPDRILVGPAVSGTNTVFWDGRDANGTAVPAGTVPYGAQVRVSSGEVHFPFLDVESNSNGLIIERLNGGSTPDYTIYYDDSPITPVLGSPPSPVTQLNGTSSAAGAHTWGGTPPDQFGDHKGIDTWTLLYSDPAPLVGGILLAQADLQINKAVTSSPILPGAPITYTITISNAGPSHTNNATVIDTIPAQITGVTWSCSQVSGGASCSPANGTGNNIAATVALSNGAVAAFTVGGILDPATTGNVVNTAVISRENDVTDPITANNRSSVTITVTAQPVIHLNKSVTPTGAVSPGQTLTYTLCYSNNGSAQATGVVLTDTLPTNTSYITGSASTTPPVEYNNGVAWSGGEPVPAGSTTALRWLINTLPNNSTTQCVAYKININAGATGNVVNAAALGSNETGEQTDSETSPIGIVDPGITKAPSVNQALPGDDVIFTITAFNKGTLPATGVTVVDNVPSFLDIVSVTSNPVRPVQITGQVFTVTIGALIPSQDVVISLRTRVNNSAGSGVQQIRNTATLGYNEGSDLTAQAVVSVPPPGGSGDGGDDDDGDDDDDDDDGGGSPPPPAPAPPPGVQPATTLPVQFLPETGLRASAYNVDVFGATIVVLLIAGVGLAVFIAKKRPKSKE